MTREEIKAALPAMVHFAEGGNLWCYDGSSWLKQTHIGFSSRDYEIKNVIEDKFFESRKALALGKKVEIKIRGEWKVWNSYGECWSEDCEYRPQADKPTFCVGDWCTDPLTREPKQVTDIFFNNGINLWMFSTNNNRDVYVIGDFRGRGKPVYEWQWYKHLSDNKYDFTTEHFTEYDNYGWQRFEPSRREKL